MSVVALLSVAPVTERSMSADVANSIRALEAYDVEYETNPMGTVIEADNVETLLEAVGAAHAAVDADRVSTLLKIDDDRRTDRHAKEKVESVETHLGHPATSRRSE